MLRNLARKVLAFGVGVADIDQPEDVVAELHRAVAPVVSVMGVWPAPYSEETVRDPKKWAAYSKMLFYHDSISQDFRRDFLTALRQYGGPSPIARRAWAYQAAFTLAEVMRELRLNGRDRWLPDLLHRHAIRDVLYCPRGRWMVVYHSKKLLRLSPGDREILVTAAGHTAGRLEELLGRKVRRLDSIPKLSPRELTTLRLYSLGNETDEIAKHLGVGEGTVQTFLKRAQKKLKAKNRAHAVRLALRARLFA